MKGLSSYLLAAEKTFIFSCNFFPVNANELRFFFLVTLVEISHLYDTPPAGSQALQVTWLTWQGRQGRFHPTQRHKGLLDPSMEG